MLGGEPDSGLGGGWGCDGTFRVSFHSLQVKGVVAVVVVAAVVVEVVVAAAAAVVLRHRPLRTPR